VRDLESGLPASCRLHVAKRGYLIALESIQGKLAKRLHKGIALSMAVENESAGLVAITIVEEKTRAASSFPTLAPVHHIPW